MHKHFKWAIVVQKEGVECRLGTKKKLKKKSSCLQIRMWSYVEIQFEI